GFSNDPRRGLGWVTPGAGSLPAGRGEGPPPGSALRASPPSPAGREKNRVRGTQFRLRRAGERAVDQRDRVVEAVDRHERAETRPLLLAEQHLIEQIEPFERNARLTVPRLDLAGAVEERLAPADL